ncbi:unnamed protein product [Calypogeia fissa]
MGLGLWKAWIGVLLVCFSCGLLVVEALRLEVPVSSTKCIADDIQEKVLTVGDYSVVSPGDGPGVTVRVTSPSGKQLHYTENVQVGQFAFTTQESGNFMVCFWIQHGTMGSSISIDLDWRTGVAAKDWAGVAKKEKLDDMQIELMKLEEAVESIHAEMLRLRKREEEMRDLNESTNARVAWFSIMSLFICMGVAGWQLWHLKSFFEKKKLL